MCEHQSDCSSPWIKRRFPLHSSRNFPQHSSEALCEEKCGLWLTGWGAAPRWMPAWLLSLAHRISRGGNCKTLNLVSRLTKCFKGAEEVDGYGSFFFNYLVPSPSGIKNNLYKKLYKKLPFWINVMFQRRLHFCSSAVRQSTIRQWRSR